MPENFAITNPSPSKRLLSPFCRVTLGEDTVFILGDGFLQSCSVTGAEGENSSSCEFSILDSNLRYSDQYFTQIFESDGLDPLVIPQQAVNLQTLTGSESLTSVQDLPQERPPTPKESRVGQQILIELGFNGIPLFSSTFLHTSIRLELFAPRKLVFGGQSANWVLNQRTKNTAFQNISFKEFCQKVCNAYGLNLEMSIEGPTYEYFPQRGQTDYDRLLSEARRQGLRVHTVGNTLKIHPRTNGQDEPSTDDDTEKEPDFILGYGENMGVRFSVSHQAQTDSSQGARASTSSLSGSTGERKFDLDPGTGVIQALRGENPIGAGLIAGAIATTGSDIKALQPVTEEDNQEETEAQTRRENELRVKGITAEFEFMTTPDALRLTPDSIFATDGVTPFLNRVWVVEKITHTYSNGGLKTTGSCYTPLKAKYIPPTTPPLVGAVPSVDGFLHPTNGAGTVTSTFRSTRRPNHQGIDIGAPRGTPVFASKDGVTSGVESSCVVGDIRCGGGYGNRVYIDHPDGSQTRYAHLTTVNVGDGQQVIQGQQIGTVGNTGHSFGDHLHYEIRIGGSPVNPLPLIT